MARIHNECVFSELFLNDLEQVASQRISEKILALSIIEKIVIIKENILSGSITANEMQREVITSFDASLAYINLDFILELNKKFCLSSLYNVYSFVNKFNWKFEE